MWSLCWEMDTWSSVFHNYSITCYARSVGTVLCGHWCWNWWDGNLSSDAISGTQGPKSIQLQGSILGIPVTILVDSGSSASFLNNDIADQLLQLSRSPCHIAVKVANGSVLYCSSAIMDCSLDIGVCQFSLDLKILQLGTYDLVLGLDWLEQFSPMKVHWKQNG